MHTVIKICLFFVGFCAVFSETFTGNAADLATQQALSYQYSSMILESQALMTAQRFLQGFIAMTAPQVNSRLEEENDVDDDRDFSLEEETPKKEKHSDLEFFGAMGFGYGAPMSGYGYEGQAAPKPSAKQIESATEYALMAHLKYVNLLTARKLETAQNTHYQSRAVTSALQGLGATNPMASSLLYMLYFRDVIQTLMSSQSVQKYDSWTLWNILEIIETIEANDKSSVPPNYKRSIDVAYATSMRVFAAETMYDFQTFMIDMYLQPMLAQLAGPAAVPVAAPTNSTSYLEVEAEAEPSKPFFGGAMGGQNYWAYYVYMMKFYAKYTMLNGAQALSFEADYYLPEAQKRFDSRIVAQLPRIRMGGFQSCMQAVQIKSFLLYYDMMMMFMAPGSPSIRNLATTNLVQTDEPRLDNPVIENQVPAPVPVAAEPQQPQAEQRQSVVG